MDVWKKILPLGQVQHQWACAGMSGRIFFTPTALTAGSSDALWPTRIQNVSLERSNITYSLYKKLASLLIINCTERLLDSLWVLSTLLIPVKMIDQVPIVNSNTYIFVSCKSYWSKGLFINYVYIFLVLFNPLHKNFVDISWTPTPLR